MLTCYCKKNMMYITQNKLLRLLIVPTLYIFKPTKATLIETSWITNIGYCKRFQT